MELIDSPEVEGMRKDVDEMNGMLEGYLAFARGDSGELAAPTHIPALLEDLRSDAERHGHTANVVYHGQPVVIVKPAAFKRCLANLVSNAARHGNAIAISGHRDHRWLTITVDDDGPGIPHGMREEVFKPFLRLDDARNIDEGGSGLGLAIARDIARSHGGDITLGDSLMGGLRATARVPVTFFLLREFFRTPGRACARVINPASPSWPIRIPAPAVVPPGEGDFAQGWHRCRIAPVTRPSLATVSAPAWPQGQPAGRRRHRRATSTRGRHRPALSRHRRHRIEQARPRPIRRPVARSSVGDTSLLAVPRFRQARDGDAASDRRRCVRHCAHHGAAGATIFAIVMPAMIETTKVPADTCGFSRAPRGEHLRFDGAMKSAATSPIAPAAGLIRRPCFAAR